MKSISFIFCLLSLITNTFAQNNSAIPLDPKIRSGVLANGMKYYISKEYKA